MALIIYVQDSVLLGWSKSAACGPNTRGLRGTVHHSHYLVWMFHQSRNRIAQLGIETDGKLTEYLLGNEKASFETAALCSQFQFAGFNDMVLSLLSRYASEERQLDSIGYGLSIAVLA